MGFFLSLEESQGPVICKTVWWGCPDLPNIYPPNGKGLGFSIEFKIIMGQAFKEQGYTLLPPLRYKIIIIVGVLPRM